MIKIILIYLFFGILIGIIFLLVVKIVKLRKIINKRLTGKELTFDDLKRFNTWSFSSFGIDERITPYGNQVYVVYRFIGSDKFDFDTYDSLHEAMKDYTNRTMKDIDKRVYNQYSNQKVKRIC